MCINKTVNKAQFVFILPFIKKLILASFIDSNKMVNEIKPNISGKFKVGNKVLME